MYFLLKMGIFQPAMLVYQRVHTSLSLEINQSIHLFWLGAKVQGFTLLSYPFGVTSQGGYPSYSTQSMLGWLVSLRNRSSVLCSMSKPPYKSDGLVCWLGFVGDQTWSSLFNLWAYLLVRNPFHIYQLPGKPLRGKRPTLASTLQRKSSPLPKQRAGMVPCSALLLFWFANYVLCATSTAIVSTRHSVQGRNKWYSSKIIFGFILQLYKHSPRILLKKTQNQDRSIANSPTRMDFFQFMANVVDFKMTGASIRGYCTVDGSEILHQPWIYNTL